MRIIHTSDWHLGQYFYGKSRANEHQQFLAWLLLQVNTHNIDAIIVAGDIFDTSTPPSYAREMYFDFIAKLHTSDCQLIVLAGNHDSVAMLSESQAVLASLSTRVVTHVVPVARDIENDTSEAVDKALTQQVFPLKNCEGQTTAIICAIPFVRPRDVVKSKAGQSAVDKQQSLQQAIADHYQQLHQYALTLAKSEEQQQGSPVAIIATGHLTALGVSISDSKSDSVRDIYIGSLEAFPASAFPPADYIALGHIHRAQQVAQTEHIRYCGSPIPLSFDEAKQDKRVLMVDFEQGKLAQVTDINVPCFQPLYMVKTSVDELEKNLQTTLAEFEIFQDKTSANKKLSAWLDIEIDNGDHLTDLSQRVSELVSDMPVEVLLVRRCKKARQRQQAQLSQQDNSMLSELSLQEVFDSRLSQLEWQTDDELARKTRLQHLFGELSEQVKLTNTAHQSNLGVEQAREAKPELDSEALKNEQSSDEQTVTHVEEVGQHNS